MTDNLKNVIDSIDKELQKEFTGKFYGIAEIVNSQAERFPVTIATRRDRINPADTWQLQTYHRILNSVALPSTESFGTEQRYNQSVMMVVIANVNLGESFIYRFANKLPQVIIFDGGYTVTQDGLSINADHEAIAQTEFGTAWEDKHRLIKNIWVITYNLVVAYCAPRIVFKVPVPPPLVFEPEYQAVIDFAISQAHSLPTYPNQVNQNELVKQMKLAGIWDQLNVFYNFLTDAGPAFAKIDWIRPDVVSYLSGTNQPTFLSGFGFTGNGLQYFETNFFPDDTNVAGRYTLTDAAIICDIDIAFNGGEQCFAGTYDIFNAYQSSSSLDPDGFVRLNIHENLADTLISSIEVPQDSFIQGSRDGDTVSIFVNGVLDTQTDYLVEGIPVSMQFYLFARNADNIPDATILGSIRMAAFGGSLAGLELIFYNIWQTYKATI